MTSQDTFLSCYRGNQSPIRHAAYMRMAKVLLLQELISHIGVGLERKSIFDYGFGSGTFFRACPASSHLFGVELDEVTVREVTSMLRNRRFDNVNLDTIRIENWSGHPFLQRTYDLIICSHVLEHLPHPAPFLARLSTCIKPDGYVLALVPINERKRDPHHVREVNQSMVSDWLTGAGLELAAWIETDSWLYWIQPLFTHNSGFFHMLAQGISLGLGTTAMAIGHSRWFGLSRAFERLSNSRPTQAAFAIRQKR